MLILTQVQIVQEGRYRKRVQIKGTTVEIHIVAVVEEDLAAVEEGIMAEVADLEKEDVAVVGEKYQR